MSQNFVYLLLATAISGLCLSMTLIGFWLASRTESFKLTWSLGVLGLVAHVIAYAFYAEQPRPLLIIPVVTLLPLGFAFIYGAAHQFFDQRPPVRRVAIASAISLFLVLLPLPFGLDGVSLIFQNFSATTLLALSGIVYRRHRAEAPTALRLMAALYFLAASSFFACGAVLLTGGQWTLGAVPDNWAERLNIIIAVLSLTGAGALSVSLDQTRLAHRHKSEALTDPLTGLLNRRGLAHALEGRTFGPFAAVAVFDLDHFKSVNDTHGHSAGDQVLSRFADVIDGARRDGDIAARLGGEEFALVMPRIMPEQAAAMTRSICAQLSLEDFEADERFRCTASGGIGFGDETQVSLFEMLTRADKALYAAKRAGRNRIEFDRLRLVG